MVQMKSACQSCGSVEWIKLSGSFEKGVYKEWCSQCTPVAPERTTPYLDGSCTPSKKYISQAKYHDAVAKANCSRKDVYL